jgi:hypothetical protein
MTGHREPRTSREIAACEVLARAMTYAYSLGVSDDTTATLLKDALLRHRTKLLNAMAGPKVRHRLPEDG